MSDWTAEGAQKHSARHPSEIKGKDYIGGERDRRERRGNGSRKKEAGRGNTKGKTLACG